MSLSQADVDALLEGTAVSAPPPSGPSAGETRRVKSSIHAGSVRRKPEVQRILGLSVPVAVVLAQRDMPIESILEMNVGTIIEFEAPFDSELALTVADRRIGDGQAVKVGENFGLKISRVGSVHDRIDAMGGR